MSRVQTKVTSQHNPLLQQQHSSDNQGDPCTRLHKQNCTQPFAHTTNKSTKTSLQAGKRAQQRRLQALTPAYNGQQASMKKASMYVSLSSDKGLPETLAAIAAGAAAG
jgi:hypothetical protein